MLGGPASSATIASSGPARTAAMQTPPKRAQCAERGGPAWSPLAAARDYCEMDQYWGQKLSVKRFSEVLLTPFRLVDTSSKVAA